MKKNIPCVSITVSYSCGNCEIVGLKRKDVHCPNCGIKLNWSLYKSGRWQSSKNIKDEVVLTKFAFETVNGGKAKFVKR